jgi:hypothetical protein
VVFRVCILPLASLELTILSLNLSFADQPPPIGLSEFDPATVRIDRELRRLSRVFVLSHQNVDVDASTETIFEAILEIDRVLNASFLFSSGFCLAPTRRACTAQP